MVIRSLIVAAAILTGTVLALPSTTFTREKPIITAAFANAPRALTVAWDHTDTGVYGFAIQLQEQNSWRDVRYTDSTFSQMMLVFLEPDTTYNLRVCAVYGPDHESDYECSDPAPATRTMAAANPASSSNDAPVIVRTETSENTIKVWWQSPEYGFFHVRWAERGLSETQDRIDSAGNHGYHAVNGLRPGETYVFRMQGCRRTLFSSSCGNWGQPIEITTAHPPLQHPTIRALPPQEPSRIKLEWTGGVDFRNTNILLYRDGRVVHDARAASGMNNPHVDQVQRPNTEYSYRICFVRDIWNCSDSITAVGKPIKPTAPVVERSSIERSGPILRGQLPRPRLEVKWRNPDIPGQFITIERVEFRNVGSGPRTRIVIGFVELSRLKAKADPVESSVELHSDSSGGGSPRERFRICAIVPVLGDAGKTCSPEFTP